LNVGQRKGRFAIPAVNCAQQGKQRGILTQWKQLPIAKCPAGGREVKGKNPNLRNELV
jgi:hypothetical protein